MSGPARRAALGVLRALFGNGRSFAETLSDAALADLTARDRSLARALAYGVARERRRLDALIDARLDRPLTGSARRLRPVLALGFYQLGWMRIDDHAAINETVALVRDRRARGLVNALLRRFQRDGSDPDCADAAPAVRWSTPDWLVTMLEADWGDRLDAILTAGNEPGPFWVRVDERQGTVDAWLEALGERGRDASPGPLPGALLLDHPVAVTELPGFDRGWVSVQDAAAQLAAPLLPAVGTGRILDVCAAPGGKTLQLAALQPEARLLALDVDPDRVERMRANFERCGATVAVTCADGTRPQGWWDGTPFQAILLDAPCSGTGVIRRHPDIKWLRRAEDIPALVSLQDRLLDAAWGMLESGGTLVYTTCSVLRDENDRRISAFLDRTAGAAAESFELPAGRAAGAGWQLLPGESAMDGFFYARIRKL